MSWKLHCYWQHFCGSDFRILQYVNEFFFSALGPRSDCGWYSHQGKIWRLCWNIQSQSDNRTSFSHHHWRHCCHCWIFRMLWSVQRKLLYGYHGKCYVVAGGWGVWSKLKVTLWFLSTWKTRQMQGESGSSSEVTWDSFSNGGVHRTKAYLIIWCDAKFSRFLFSLLYYW